MTKIVGAARFSVAGGRHETRRKARKWVSPKDCFAAKKKKKREKRKETGVKRKENQEVGAGNGLLFLPRKVVMDEWVEWLACAELK